MGLGVLSDFGGGGIKGVLFVFRITSYIPADYLEECEGAKFFQL